MSILNGSIDTNTAVQHENSLSLFLTYKCCHSITFAGNTLVIISMLFSCFISRPSLLWVVWAPLNCLWCLSNNFNRHWSSFCVRLFHAYFLPVLLDHMFNSNGIDSIYSIQVEEEWKTRQKVGNMYPAFSDGTNNRKEYICFITRHTHTRAIC